MDLLEPMVVTIDGKEFILSKFPAVSGREIVAKYSLSSLPKIGDYQVNEETMLKLMNHVAVDAGDPHRPLRLSTVALINNHAGNWETLTAIEREMMRYNCTFFPNGQGWTFLNDIIQTALVYFSRTLTGLSGQSSATVKPPSTS